MGFARGFYVLNDVMTFSGN